MSRKLGVTGNLPIDVIRFTFVGDTSDVQPFSFGDVHGWQNPVGTASISVNDYATGALVAQGTFWPITGTLGGVAIGAKGGRCKQYNRISLGFHSISSKKLRTNDSCPD
jgi:hypothetical protein